MISIVGSIINIVKNDKWPSKWKWSQETEIAKVLSQNEETEPSEAIDKNSSEERNDSDDVVTNVNITPPKETQEQADKRICDEIYTRIITYQTNDGKISYIQNFLNENKNVSPAVAEYIYPMLCEKYLAGRYFDRLDTLLEKIKDNPKFTSMVKKFYWKMWDTTQYAQYYEKGGFTQQAENIREREREKYLNNWYSRAKKYSLLWDARDSFQSAGLSKINASKKVRNIIKEVLSNEKSYWDAPTIHLERFKKEYMYIFPKEVQSDINHWLWNEFIKYENFWDAYLCFKDANSEKWMDYALDKLEDQYWEKIMELKPRYNQNEEKCEYLLDQAWERFSSANHLHWLKMLHEVDAFRWIEWAKNDRRMSVTKRFVTDYWIKGYIHSSTSVGLKRLAYLYEVLGNHEWVKEVNKKISDKDYVGDREIQEKKRCWINYKEIILRRATNELKNKDKISMIEKKLDILEKDNKCNFDDLLELAKDMNIWYI